MMLLIALNIVIPWVLLLQLLQRGSTRISYANK
jgi:hypothetical protein